MEQSAAIIELGGWLKTPPGQYLLAWEQAQIDRAVCDLFGYHALQVGLPEIDALRANRMPHRWRATFGRVDVETVPSLAPHDVEPASTSSPVRIGLRCDAAALPFPSNSLDLVVMPHALELASDPHRALSEAQRVLMPEGRLVIAGFNPASLWGARQRLGRTRHQLGIGDDQLFLPSSGEFIGYWRLRDWLKLLGFEIEAGRFGCYRPPWTTDKWLTRYAWMDKTGDRWWPVLGAVYFLVAVRRVRGMRLVGRIRKERVKPSPAPALVSHRKR